MGRRLLVVDDEPMIIRLMKMSLQGAGYEVVTACDGAKAVEQVRLQCPHVLITDLEMPVMTGEELIREVRAQGHTFPIFVLTSKTAVDHRHWSENYERLNFLEKPVSMRLLLSALSQQFVELQAAGETV